MLDEDIRGKIHISRNGENGEVIITGFVSDFQSFPAVKLILYFNNIQVMVSDKREGFGQTSSSIFYIVGPGEAPVLNVSVELRYTHQTMTRKLLLDKKTLTGVNQG